MKGNFGESIIGDCDLSTLTYVSGNHVFPGETLFACGAWNKAVEKDIKILLLHFVNICPSLLNVTKVYKCFVAKCWFC